jgi:hypothetical protein
MAKKMVRPVFNFLITGLPGQLQSRIARWCKQGCRIPSTRMMMHGKGSRLADNRDSRVLQAFAEIKVFPTPTLETLIKHSDSLYHASWH